MDNRQQIRVTSVPIISFFKRSLTSEIWKICTYSGERGSCRETDRVTSAENAWKVHDSRRVRKNWLKRCSAPKIWLQMKYLIVEAWNEESLSGEGNSKPDTSTRLKADMSVGSDSWKGNTISALQSHKSRGGARPVPLYQRWNNHRMCPPHNLHISINFAKGRSGRGIVLYCHGHMRKNASKPVSRLFYSSQRSRSCTNITISAFILD